MGQSLVIEGRAHEGDLGTLAPSFFLSLCFLVTMRYSDMCSHHSLEAKSPPDHVIK